MPMAGTRRAAHARPRPATRTLILAMLVLAGGAAARPARAEPYMAIREGRKCSSCHVNMDGAGMRTLLADTHMQEITHYRDVIPELASATEVFNPQITPFLRVGGDLRLDDQIVFQDQPDAQGLVPHKVLRGDVDENILDFRRAPLYLLLGLVPDYLEVYLDESFAPNGVVTRELFGLLKGVLPWKGYLKAGKFFLDYGLRTADDTLFSLDNNTNKQFVRGRTGTDFESQQTGGEIGFQPGPFHFTVQITGGASGEADVRETSNLYAMLTDLPVVDNLIVGASFMHLNPSSEEDFIYGAYAGSTLGALEYQAECDWIHVGRSDSTKRASGAFLAYGEVNYLLLGWINVKGFGEYADTDPNAQTLDSAQNRFGFGIEPFLGRFLQTRLFYSIANGPKSRPVDNQNRVVLELHLFF
jgi:hypothetical protein